MNNLKKKQQSTKGNPLKDVNPYEHVFELYNKDATAYKDFSKFHSKFKDKTFYEQYRLLHMIALCFGVLVGACCVFLAFTYIKELLGAGIGNTMIAGVIAGVLLLVWEYGLKAMIIPMATTSVLSRKGSSIILVPICVAIIAGSMFTTLQGSNKLFYTVGTQNTDIRADKDLQINELVGRQKKILADRDAYQKRNPKKSASWLGADEMKSLDNQILAIRSEKKTEVEELSTTKEGNTKHLFILSLVCEFLILICYIFIGFYQWKSYRERLVLDPEFVNANTIEVKHLTRNFDQQQLPRIAAETNQDTPTASTKNTIGFRRNESDSKTCNSGVCGNDTEQAQKTCNDVGTGIEGDLATFSEHYQITGKTLTYHQVTDRLNKYQGFKKRGERNTDTVNARINYFSFLLDHMEDAKANRVQEIKFVKGDWLNPQTNVS